MLEVGIPLSEVERWDLDDIRQMNSALDMKADYEAAADAYQAAEMDKRQQDRRKV